MINLLIAGAVGYIFGTLVTVSIIAIMCRLYGEEE